MAMTARKRADLLLVERGLFESRAKAQAAIAAGLVTADGEPVRKPSDAIAVDCVLRAAGASLGVARRREARGRARSFRIRSGRPRLSRRRRLDRRLHRGAAGARRAARLRGRRRARPASRAPARRGPRSSRSKAPTSASSIRRGCRSRPIFVTVDVSFISLKLVLPAALALARPPAQARRADQAAIRGRAGPRQEGHRARSGGPRRGLRRHRGIRGLARLARRGHHPVADHGRRWQSRVLDRRARAT